MSDINISGIPNMGFAGGGGGYLGGIPNVAPAMSSAQIMASLYGNYSPGAAQSTFNQISGGLTQDPARYAALGAAYGRQVAPSSPAAVAASNASRGITPGGGGGGGYQTDPFSGAITGYNAPMSYGWDANEGAPVPVQPAPFQRGMFNPQTYGWDHNEGAPAYTPPAAPNWNDLWKSRIAPQVPTFPSSVTVPQQQSGSFGMNLGGYQTDPFSGAIMGMGGGGYDMSAQSRAYQSPLQGFDWGQSYGTAGGANANLLRTAGGASSGYYNPQLDWLSRSTLGMNNQPVDYSHMFGAPNSGYLGSQGRLNQDPFGGYVNPRDLDAGGSFPADYAPRFNAYGNAFNQ